MNIRFYEARQAEISHEHHTDDIKLEPRIKLTTTGEEAGASVARGDADLGGLPVSEILPVPGVEVLGTFPKEVQGYVVMAAGVSSKAAQGSAANELIRFLMAPAGSSILKSKGMERP